MEEDILNILRETAQLLRDTAQDRRDQANMFYDLLQKQAKAISDSEERIGKINTMVNNVLEQTKEQSRIAADNAASLQLGCMAGKPRPRLPYQLQMAAYWRW